MSTHAEMIEAQRRACEKASFYRSMGMPTYLLPLSLDALAALLRERDEAIKNVDLALEGARKLSALLTKAEQQRDQWREVAEALVEALTLVGKHVSAVTPEINTGKVIDAAIARFDALKAQEAGQ